MIDVLTTMSKRPDSYTELEIIPDSEDERLRYDD